MLGLSLISFAAFAGPDDCCPTCETSTAPADPAGMAMVANDDSTCAEACCSSETPTAATFAVEVPNQPDPAEEAPCAASCCATTNDTSSMVAKAPDERDATCCADGEPTAIATATEGPEFVAPAKGAKATFGTNPMAFGIPQAGKEPLMFDMSTSAVALFGVLRWFLPRVFCVCIPWFLVVYSVSRSAQKNMYILFTVCLFMSFLYQY